VQRPRRRQNPQELKLKPGQLEDSIHGVEQTDEAQRLRMEETGAEASKSLAHSLVQAEEHMAKEAKEAWADATESNEAEEQTSTVFGRLFAPKPSAHKSKDQQQQSMPQPQQPPKKALRDGFEKKEQRPEPLLVALSAMMPARPVAEAKLTANPPPSRPGHAHKDAFSALKEAQDQGVLLRLEWEQGEHAEENENPELAAAVEEVIRAVFGQPGILRVGPAKDETGAVVIAVVATTGFSHGAFASIPETARGFLVVLALSFDLLPLKRDR
jgi:hypothetical protein